jgi:glucose-6-phosphate isomerase
MFKLKGEIEISGSIFSNSHLIGADVTHTVKTLQELDGIFEDAKAFKNLRGDQTIYEVDSFMPVESGTEGGLFFGVTVLFPGGVGNEFFMTKGHFHKVENRAEYYWGIEGEGILLLMDKTRNTRAEYMFPGSLHYIPGCTAHRVSNIGSNKLKFGACWPADAGYNYQLILNEGFSKRVKKIEGKPILI